MLIKTLQAPPSYAVTLIPSPLPHEPFIHGGEGITFNHASRQLFGIVPYFGNIRSIMNRSGAAISAGDMKLVGVRINNMSRRSNGGFQDFAVGFQIYLLGQEQEVYTVTFKNYSMVTCSCPWCAANHYCKHILYLLTILFGKTIMLEYTPRGQSGRINEHQSNAFFKHLFLTRNDFTGMLGRVITLETILSNNPDTNTITPANLKRIMAGTTLRNSYFHQVNTVVPVAAPVVNPGLAPIVPVAAPVVIPAPAPIVPVAAPVGNNNLGQAPIVPVAAPVVNNNPAPAPIVPVAVSVGNNNPGQEPQNVSDESFNAEEEEEEEGMEEE